MVHRPSHPLRTLALAALAAAHWAAFATPPARARATASVRSSYRIGAGDRIKIRVEEMPSLDEKELEVGDDGTLDLPQVGNVPAQGLTAGELADVLRQRLEDKGLRRATVSVEVTGFLSRPVTVLGAVEHPGNQPIPGVATLLEVLMAAGGPAADHDGWIEVRRQADNGLADRVRIDIRDLIGAGDPAVNIPIFAGDVIHLPRVGSLRIHFLGKDLSGEQIFSSAERVTLLTALARAGGLPGEASNKIRIVRSPGTPEEHEIVVNYRRILQRKDPDPELRDGDLVILKEGFF